MALNLRTTAFVLALATLSAGTAQANLLINPGFETGDLTGWTQSGNGGFTGVDGTAHSGSFAAFLGPVGSDGFLSQTLSTTAGANYSISFWLQSDGLTPNDFNVTFDGNSVFAQSNIASSSYTKFTVNGIASTASTVIQFGFRDDPGFLHLDDTNVEAVPEPGTLALLGAGVVAFGASRRRRKSR